MQAQLSRTLLLLYVPEPLHDKLQVGGLDFVAVRLGAVPFGESAHTALARCKLIRPELIENRVNQTRLDLDGRLVHVQLVEARYRLLDRLSRGFPGQVLQVEIVAVYIADPAFEQVSQCEVRVLPDRDKEVRPEISPVDAGSKLVGEGPVPHFPRPVQEVLLKLIKDHQQGRVGSSARRLDRLVQPIRRRRRRRGRLQERADRLMDLADQLQRWDRLARS